MRDPHKTRSAILQAGFEVFYQNGFRASSINDVVAKTGLTQGAFFHYFPTKNDLGYAVADEVLKDIILDRWTRPLAAYKNPIQGMISTFRKLMEATSEEELALGCPLNNLTQEMSSADPVFRDKLRAVLISWVDETEKHLRRAQADGYLKPDVNVKVVAPFVVMMEEGSGAMVKNLRDRKVYWALYEGFRHYLTLISLRPVGAD